MFIIDIRDSEDSDRRSYHGTRAMLDTADIVINDSKTYGPYNWQTRPFYSRVLSLHQRSL